MFQSAWLRALFAHRTRRPRRPPARRSTHPRLETLEDRLTPAVLTVNTLADNTTPDNYLSLREAIDVVNDGSTKGLNHAEKAQITGALGSNDTIKFDPSLFPGSQQTITLADQTLQLQQDMTIAGPGASQLAIDGGGAVTVFTIDPAVRVALSGLTITHGCSSSDLTEGGGGIFNAGTLTLSDSILTENITGGLDTGGGILNQGTLTVIDSTLTQNFAKQGNVYGGVGGAIANNGIATISNSTFLDNQTYGLAPPIPGGPFNGFNGYFGVGGALFNDGTMTVTASIFKNNQSYFGGGIFNSNMLTISDCSISGNSAVHGAGIADDGILGGVGSGVSTVSDCTISDNDGSGIFNRATANLSGCTISENVGDGINNSGTAALNDCTISRNGMGIFNAGMLTVSDCTISSNSADSGNGGGIDNSGSDPKGTLVLRGSIVSGNTNGSKPDDIIGVVQSQGFNLIQTPGKSTGYRSSDLLGVDPLLAPLGSYGGPTQTMALLPGSPAIDAGKPTDTTPDQRGVAVLNSRDIGAFESQGFQIAVSSGSNQTAAEGSAFVARLVIVVTANAAQEPVAGGQIVFTAPASGASARLRHSTVTLNQDGQASVKAIANKVSGTYSVTATAAGITTAPAVFTLTNEVPAASSTAALGGSTDSETPATSSDSASVAREIARKRRLAARRARRARNEALRAARRERKEELRALRHDGGTTS